MPSTSSRPDSPGSVHGQWAERDGFLGRQDERTVIAERIASLKDVFARERQRIADHLHGSRQKLEERLAAADKTLADAHGRLSDAFRDPTEQDATNHRSRRALANELERLLARLYQPVRAAPGRILDQSSPRSSVRTLLESLTHPYETAIDALPDSALIIKARRDAPHVPPGERICDVQHEALAAAGRPTRVPFLRAARCRLAKAQRWATYELVHVPVRDVARRIALETDALDAAGLTESYTEAHRNARSALDESWQIIRSNVEVVIDELLQEPPAPDDEETETDPKQKATELGDIALGSLQRAQEKLSTIADPYSDAVSRVIEEVETHQSKTIERLEHDLERSEDFSVRLGWMRRRVAGSAAMLLSRLGKRVSFLWRRASRLARRGYYRAEDTTLRLGSAIGLRTQTQETLLALADLPNAREIEEHAKTLPPIYRRLFSSAPLQTREMLVGRDKVLRTLAEVLERWRSGRPSSVAVIGPQGSGKTTLLNCFEAELSSAVTVDRFQIESRIDDVDELIRLVSGWLQLEGVPGDLQELSDRMSQLAERILLVEGADNLMLRRIGGKAVPEAFMSLMLSTRSTVLWILTAREYPWRRMEESLHIGQYFTHTVRTPFHSAQDLQEAILLRHRSSGLKLSFSEKNVNDRKVRKLLLSHTPDSEPVQTELKNKYFSTLFDATGGQMDSAIFYWLGSLSADSDGERLVASAIQRPNAAFISSFDRLYLFTLAEIINNGSLTASEHALIFRTDPHRSMVVMNYLQQLSLITARNEREGDNDIKRFSVNPVLSHMLSSTLETIRILY